MSHVQEGFISGTSKQPKIQNSTADKGQYQIGHKTL